jgi:UDP-arabinose 4-epimerase
MKKILVTGGAGYIGSHACKALARSGYKPIVYDNLERGHPNAVKWGPLEVGSLADGARLDDVIRRHRPVCVLHFAAYAYVGESVRNPGLYYRNNVAGSLSLLDAMHRNDIGAIVFSSTCATYGIPKVVPVIEDTPQNPINPYGYTKLVVERILRDYEQAYGLRWMALRYFNAAGADPDGEIGERHNPETHAIPLAIMAVLRQDPGFQILGDDYPTPDGTCIRDYIHVCDLANAHVAALAHLEAGKPSMAINLGTGRGTSVWEIVQVVEQVSGQTVPTVIKPRRPGDPPVLEADATKARTLLGWEPLMSSMEQIVGTAYRWYSQCS